MMPVCLSHQSMIDAFAAGGCFHSRTAMGMFPYIKKAVDEGEVLLEWDYSQVRPGLAEQSHFSIDTVASRELPQSRW